MVTTRGALLLMIFAGGCVHEVKKTPSPSLLPPGKVAVIGEVPKPGLIDFQPGMTVTDALRAAGGLAPMAAADGAMLTRSVSGLVASTSVHLAAIVEGREPDVPLEDGDVIQVPAQSGRPATRRLPAELEGGSLPPDTTTEPRPDDSPPAP